jgi:glycyl-tRNA synthetase beta chain
MATLLLELFSEEIPSRMQRGAAEQLQRLITAGFDKAGLKAEEAKTYVSPRHLAISLSGLPLIQPDVKEERKGPKVGAPEQAMKGFLTAVGLTAEQCEQRDGYYYATIERKGQPVADVAKKIIEEALSAFGWPKSMKWGNRPMQWVRPLHRIVALLDDKIIPAQFGHLTASNVTEGHRFLSSGTITLGHANDYLKALADAHVMVDYAARRGAIAAGVEAVASSHSLKLIQDEALLDEVTGLVEWPVPLLGTFEEKFLALPQEVLISEMKTHQRYFALQKADGSLAHQFITVANMVTKDAGKKVMEGNSRVVRARLSDGEFYWEQDKKTPLEAWGKKLSDVVFHAKVGMMDAKVARIEKLSVAIATKLCHPGRSEGSATPEILRYAQDDYLLVRRTARLAKADLTSGMVGEFPELQGIMGRYYALAQGEKPEIADAIRDHYKPLGANDSTPESPLAAIVGTADKLDSILSLFKAGEKPTGSKDPLALRRAALGILRTMLDKEWSFDLNKIIHASIDMDSTEAKQSAADVILFFVDRMKVLLRDNGIRHDIIDAAVKLPSGTNVNREYSFDPLAIAKRARTLTTWLNTPGGKDALAAIKRTLNILAAEEKKAKTPFMPSNTGALAQPAEKILQQSLQQKAAAASDLEALTAPINQFFTDILVTEPEFRDARLGLLASVRATASTIADFSKIEG